MPTQDYYDRERERSRRVQSEKSNKGRDVFDSMPEAVDPARREACGNSFKLFAETYFPEVFSLAWSEDHLEAIALIEQVTLRGGLFSYAMPRGNGKTSLAETAVLWATLYGRRQFPLVIGSDEEAAEKIINSIKSELENNDLLFEDFPEVCHPIRSLEGIANRAKGQLCDGERTYIEWTAKHVVLPTVKGSPASAAIIAVVGITGSIRGRKFKRPDGKSVRPDLVLIDDPQTDESARSPTQSQQRIRILNGAVLGLAGPGRKIAGIMPCTVIARQDLADEMLDRQKYPQWQGKRTKLIYSWPTNETLWEQYKKIRDESLRAGNGGREATEFYRENREAMDVGAKVAWPARFNPDEISALQNVMNLRADLKDPAFFAEYQNEPLDETVSSEFLTADQIAAKVNGRDRRIVPREASKLVAFIDVQKAALPWVVCAFESDFTGYVVDYGTFPDQHREYFSLSTAKRTLASVLKTDSLEATIYQGLANLTSQLLGSEWKRDDGTTCRVDLCLIDANWGDSSDVVYKFCRESNYAANLVPTHGRFVGASSTPFNEFKRKPGDEIGDHWRKPVPQNRRGIRYGLFDANFWKTFVQERLLIPIGGRGCLSLFGSESERHKLFADHMTAENGVATTAKGRTVTEWKIKASRPDNHWLDGVVGCYVAASMLRISLDERKQAARKPKAKVKLSELQRMKHGG